MPQSYLDKLDLNFKNDVLKYTVRLPSGDNCQPFRIKFSNNYLQIFHIEKIGKHEFNQKNISSLVSYGCIKKIIQIVCSHYNLDPIFNEQDDLQKESSHLWSTVHFISKNQTPIDLLNEILKRTTHRGSYQPLVNTDIEKIQKNLSSNFHLKVIDKKLAETLAKNDSLLWKNTKALKDLFKLTNFFKSKKTGFNRENLYVPPLDILTLFLIKCFRFLPKLFFPYLQFRFAKHYLNHGCLTYNKKCHNTQDFINLGEECFLTWLKLTKESYSLQPVTTSSQLLFSQFPQSELFESKLKELTNLNDNHFIAWAFRIGKPIKPVVYAERISIDTFQEI